MNFDTIRAEALKLPLQARGHLASDLLKSLEAFDRAENEKFWLDEAAKRAVEIDSGAVQLIPSDVADRELREFLAA
jgi:Putative addiction module component